MSAATMWEGLQIQLSAVDGLVNVIAGEPSVVHDMPSVYGVLFRFDRTQHGQVTAMHYTFTLRLVIRWQDQIEAEAQLISFINSIPAAIDEDATLGGRITMGLAKITAGDTGYQTIGQTVFRICDFTADVLEKAAVRSGI